MLVQRIHDLFKFNLGISRQIQLQKVHNSVENNDLENKNSLKVSRLTTGPEIRGCRPVLVAFLQFKVKFSMKMFQVSNRTSSQDREEVLSKTKLLKSSNIYVSEDLSRKTREQRTELFKYIRFVS